MTIKVFAIHDGKAKAFQQPFFSVTVGMAIRAFQDHCEDPKTIAHRHPEDFVLYELGTYDDNTGEIVTHNPMSLAATATEFVRKPAPLDIIQEIKEAKASKKGE